MALRTSMRWASVPCRSAPFFPPPLLSLSLLFLFFHPLAGSAAPVEARDVAGWLQALRLIRIQYVVIAPTEAAGFVAKIVICGVVACKRVGVKAAAVRKRGGIGAV